MPSTYNLISSNTLSTTTASVTFSAIPSTFTDLVLKISARNNGTTTIVNVRFNGDTTANNYSSLVLRGTGSTVTSFSYDSTRTSLFQQDGVNPSANYANSFSTSEIYIPSYTTTRNKSISGSTNTEDNSTTAYISKIAHLWTNPVAITSINLFAASDSFVSGSSFYLYGIKNS
jgi:hypothetical protein